jgi:hypothetical protein
MVVLGREMGHNDTSDGGPPISVPDTMEHQEVADSTILNLLEEAFYETL